MKKAFLIAVLAFLSLMTAAQNKLTTEEKQYLEFLYEYMPLSDKLDYDSSFFIAQVKSAIKARNTFSWGRNVPEDIFKHFVLVYRVNNENLDTARMVMFRMIKDKIKNMSMYDAALEVNHWCHEFVNYKASDGRTSAPLASMRTSWGRCGEESTFTVTALRSVGIPARQCYTPRWAHTDDNHAWVEVWVDGKWYHLGACEPEAKLNVGWFDAPAKRSMMVHTTVFGKYNGSEEKNFVSDKYSKINLLSNYAPVKKLTVNVSDEKGNKIKGAQVSFGLYNYAEYYPLAKITTDADGKAALTTGYGDLMIWVKSATSFAQKQAFANDTEVNIILPKGYKEAWEELSSNKLRLVTITPPKEFPIETLDEKLVKKNNERLVVEDSIRNAYIATFPNTNNNLIKNSWGNYREIQKVLDSKHPLAEKMLNMVYEKDLRDGEYSVFMDHLTNIKDGETSEYVINPRIALEKITPWRSFIKNYFKQIRYVFANGSDLSEWIRINIKINATDNYYGVPISPEGVLKARQCDKKSREILFVAIARTFGIQARYEWATGRAQWRKNDNSEWIYAFKEGNKKENNNCVLVVNNDKNNTIKPEYYMQFTVQKLAGGEFQTLDYEYDPHFDKFPDTLKLGEGEYRLIVGNRNSSGKVQVSETYFTLQPDQVTSITITIPEVTEDVTSYGRVNLDNTLNNIVYKTQFKDKTYNIKNISDNNKAVILAIIDPYKEPSRHLLVDIAKSKADFDKNNDVTLVLVLDESLLNKDFTTNVFPVLPENTIVLLDKNKTIEKKVIKATDLQFLNNYPILTLINKDDIVYLSQGYKISSQEELLKVINKLK
ncbi:MAG: transglutaminase domain-containing protein [Bacteroidales bacterium]|nr:transglutaminase domain-containing protein [Bacteroidales bacterium]